jgi:hypothetical protein
MNGDGMQLPRVLLLGGLLVVAAAAVWAIGNASAGNPTPVADRRQGEVPSSQDSNSHSGSPTHAVAVAASNPPTSTSQAVVGTVVSEEGRSGQHVDQDGKFPVTIRKPAGRPWVELGPPGALGAHDSKGKPLTVACSTCHAARPPNLANRASADLDEFHQNLTFAHGNLTCLACHNPRDYDTLHLADGRSVEYPEVMTLCGQCHGTKTRDYEHGAHGGMTGYWDLSQGPRMRLNCVDCHPPHDPRFPLMKPTFKTRDRFLSGASSADQGRPGGSSHER